jgi:hypothetical protein
LSIFRQALKPEYNRFVNQDDIAVQPVQVDQKTGARKILKDMLAVYSTFSDKIQPGSSILDWPKEYHKELGMWSKAYDVPKKYWAKEEN